MFIVYDKATRRPYDKHGHGHFTVYASQKAASNYIGRNYLRKRCEVKRITKLAVNDP